VEATSEQLCRLKYEDRRRRDEWRDGFSAGKRTSGPDRSLPRWRKVVKASMKAEDYGQEPSG